MNDSTVRRVPEGVIHRGQVRTTAPTCGDVGRRDLFSNKVPEDRELIVEGVVHSNKLFPHVGRRIRSTDERASRSGSREDTSLQKRLSVGIEERSWDRVV